MIHEVTFVGRPPPAVDYTSSLRTSGIQQRSQIDRRIECEFMHRPAGSDGLQDPILVQQSVNDDPQEERNDHGNEKDGLERVPRTLGSRPAAAAPDFAAAVFARRRVVAAVGIQHRRRHAATRRGHHFHLT